MKGLILFCVFSACTFAGFYKTYWMRKRKILLHEIGDIVFRIGEDIRISGKPLFRLAALVGRENSLFGSVFVEGTYPQNKIRFGRGLLTDDWEIVDPFFESLGKTDTEGQIKFCSVTCERLAVQEEKVGRENEKKCRLYSYFGVLSGLFFVIILL